LVTQQCFVFFFSCITTFMTGFLSFSFRTTHLVTPAPPLIAYRYGPLFYLLLLSTREHTLSFPSPPFPPSHTSVSCFFFTCSPTRIFSIYYYIVSLLLS